MYMLSEREKLRIPITPPYMGNKGHYTASLGRTLPLPGQHKAEGEGGVRDLYRLRDERYPV